MTTPTAQNPEAHRTVDGQVPDGSTRRLPDGSTLHGAPVGKDFVSADGHTVVLGDGTVLHGTMDTSTGIFTADDGGSYFAGKDGIRHGAMQNDGSLMLDDHKTRVMTPKSWQVDLKQMADAIVTIQAKADAIHDHNTTINQSYSDIKHAWSSPAGQTFEDVADQAHKAMSGLRELLADMIDCMQKTHDTYERTELANVKNVTPQ